MWVQVYGMKNERLWKAAIKDKRARAAASKGGRKSAVTGSQEVAREERKECDHDKSYGCGPAKGMVSNNARQHLTKSNNVGAK